MSKQVMKQARDALYHMCVSTRAIPGKYNEEIVRDAMIALDHALDDQPVISAGPITPAMKSEITEEVRKQIAEVMNTITRPTPVTFGGCPQRRSADPDDRCAVCGCWKSFGAAN